MTSLFVSFDAEELSDAGGRREGEGDDVTGDAVAVALLDDVFVAAAEDVEDDVDDEDPDEVADGVGDDVDDEDPDDVADGVGDTVGTVPMTE